MTVDSYTSDTSTIVIHMLSKKKTDYNQWIKKARKFVIKFEGIKCSAISVDVK
jgi:hypothetical protein